MAKYGIGKYLVELLGTQGFSETSTGNHQFFMKFIVRGIWDHATGQWAQCEEGERTWYRVITAKSAEYAAEDFRALGFPGDKFSQLDPRHPEKHIFTGQIEMTCTIEHYNNRDQEKWNVVRPDSGGGWEEKTIAPDKIKQLDMLFGKALASIPKSPMPAASAQAKQPTPLPTPTRSNGLVSQPRAAAAPAQQPPLDSGITDNDIPF